MFCEKLSFINEPYRKNDYTSALSFVKKGFINTQSEKEKFVDVEFVDEKQTKDGMMLRASTFFQKIQKHNFKKELDNLITYGLAKFLDNYKNHDEDNLVLYEKYNTCPIFVTYEKKDDIVSSTKYEDQFINEQIFRWMTRSRVSMESQETRALINAEHNGLKIYLFIKKSDGEGSNFYYMGKVYPRNWM